MTPRVVPMAEDALRSRPMDYTQLAKAVHCHGRTAARTLAKMHAAGLLHIVEWRRSSRGPAVAVYAWGAGQDAPRIEPLTMSERRAAMQRRMSAEDRDFKAARRRQIRRKVRPDPLVAAFFGVKR